jgi:hypothetical protein
MVHGNMAHEHVYQPATRAGDVLIFSEAATHGSLPWTREDKQRRVALFRFSPGNVAYGVHTVATHSKLSPGCSAGSYIRRGWHRSQLHGRGASRVAGCNVRGADRRAGRGAASEKDTKLAQKLGQLKPFLAAFPEECMGQLQPFIAVFSPECMANLHLLGQPNTFPAAVMIVI